MPQNVVVGATQADTNFPAGTQAIGFHRFTLQLPPGAVVTHLETVDSTTFGAITEAGEYIITYATIGVDAVTVIGPVISVTQNIGAQVTLLVAAGITVQVITV